MAAKELHNATNTWPKLNTCISNLLVSLFIAHDHYPTVTFTSAVIGPPSMGIVLLLGSVGYRLPCVTEYSGHLKQATRSTDQIVVHFPLAEHLISNFENRSTPTLLHY
uniref:Uncharacterized protein n=1 Tax=Glossina austeni TaxID=7395 RepID=A0A1A9VTQ2_GLOAU